MYETWYVMKVILPLFCKIQIDETLERVDTIVGRLMDSIVEVGMENCVNIMVVSDHGMANTPCADQNTPIQLYMLNDVSTLLILFFSFLFFFFFF